MIDRRVLAILFAALLPLAAWAGDGAAEARITYLTGSSVYVNAGGDEGLWRGSELEVLRDGSVVAVLEVTENTNRRAVCSVKDGEVPLRVGDAVRYKAGDPPAATNDDSSKSRSRRGLLRHSGIHGRVGVRFLTVRDRMSDGPEYSQPGLDLRLDSDAIGGGPWNLALDVRTRRTYRDLADGGSDDDSRSRVYRMAVGWNGADGPWRFTAGRQFSPALSAVSTFDGLSASYDRERWSAGIITGSQPDAEDYGYASDVKEHGVYVQFRGTPAPRRSWSWTTGLIGSYEDSEVSREFLYLQGRFRAERLTAYFTSQVDFNRDWKQDEAGEDSISFTSGFASVHYRVNDVLRLRGGYDNRRNVRLYRDRVTPETDFDDEFRRGGWLGMSLRMKNRYSFGLDARSNRGGSAGTADSYTGTFGVSRLTRAQLGLNLRATRYENDRLEGWLYSLSAGLDLGQRVYAQVSGGIRDETNISNPVFDDTMNWFGVDVDVSLGRRFYLLLSAERTTGDFEEVDQFFSRLSYRF